MNNLVVRLIAADVLTLQKDERKSFRQIDLSNQKCDTDLMISMGANSNASQY